MELQSDEGYLTENKILKKLLHEFYFGSDKNDLLQTIINLTIFISLVKNNPMVGYKWISVNRLSMLAVSGFTCGIYDELNRLVTYRDVHFFYVLSRYMVSQNDHANNMAYTSALFTS